MFPEFHKHFPTKRAHLKPVDRTQSMKREGLLHFLNGLRGQSRAEVDAETWAGPIDEGVTIKLPQTVTLLTLTCACRSPLRTPRQKQDTRVCTHIHTHVPQQPDADVPVCTSGNSWASEHICSVLAGNSEGSSLPQF